MITLEPQDRPVEIITLVGEQDADSAERIKNEIAVLLDSGSRIVVDLTDATFVGSQTLSVLLIGQHQAERASLGFTLALPQGNFTQLHRILRMTGLGSSFAIYATLQEAVAGARAGCTARRSVKVA